MQIRLLETGYNPAFYNMGVDEALLHSVLDEPVLRLYGWRPPAVSVGYFQDVYDEVDVGKCKEMGVDVVRRITGGGAVFHDAELTYSFITRSYPQNILESYQLICGAIICGFKGLGFAASFAPLNDIVVDGKKVSGNAQTRKNGVLLQHGTILLDVDVDKMFSLLKVSDEKMKDKLIKNVKECVTGLGCSFEEASAALKRGFTETFGAELAASELTAEETAEAERLAKEKFSSREWLEKRTD